MTIEDLAELDRLCTPGPWRVDGEEIHAAKDIHVVCFGHDYDDYGRVGARHPKNWFDAEQLAAYQAEQYANLRLLALARELLAEVIRLRGIT